MQARRIVLGTSGALLLVGSALLVVMGADRPAPAAPMPTPTATSRPGCPACHSSRDVVKARPGRDGERLYVPADVLAGTVHASLTCTSCHPPVSVPVHANRSNELRKVRGSCVTCHSRAGRDYQAGAHGPGSSQPLIRPGQSPPPPGKDGKPSVRPTCVSCHNEHRVQKAKSRAFVTSMARACSGCHIERGESFFDRNYHGKETRLGREDVASCADCHGPHLVLAAKDSRSMVGKQNVLETCKRCHKKATANFAQIEIHVLGNPLPSDPKLRAVTLYMLAILVFTFGFFGVHTALGIRHAWSQSRTSRERKEGTE